MIALEPLFPRDPLSTEIDPEPSEEEQNEQARRQRWDIIEDNNHRGNCGRG